MKQATEKKLPKKSKGAEIQEQVDIYLHWKHATFGPKSEETKEDVDYKARV